MKKCLLLILAFLLALTPCSLALAGEETLDGSNPSAVIPVTGKYVSGAQSERIVSVKISWGSMEFQYTDASQGTWNPATHEYDHATAAAWTCGEGENEISVVNHSNTEIDVSFSFHAAQGSNVTGKFSSDSLQLATAVGTAVDAAPSGKTAFDVLSGSIQKDGSLGTITVSIDPNAMGENTQTPSGGSQEPVGDPIVLTFNTSALDADANVDASKNVYFYDVSGSMIHKAVIKNGDSVSVPNGAVEMEFEFLYDGAAQPTDKSVIPVSSCTIVVDSTGQFTY